jgi:hypothetical protein
MTKHALEVLPLRARYDPPIAPPRYYRGGAIGRHMSRAVRRDPSSTQVASRPGRTEVRSARSASPRSSSPAPRSTICSSRRSSTTSPSTLRAASRARARSSNRTGHGTSCSCLSCEYGHSIATFPFTPLRATSIPFIAPSRACARSSSAGSETGNRRPRTRALRVAHRPRRRRRAAPRSRARPGQ